MAKWVKVITAPGTNHIKPSAITGYLNHTMKYMKAWEKLDFERVKIHGDWSWRNSNAYYDVKKAVDQAWRIEANTELTSDEAIQEALTDDGGNATALLPAQTELVRTYYRKVADELKANGYKKLPNFQSHLKQTGWADYLDCIRALFMIAVGYNGGQRARTDYQKLTIHDFKVIPGMGIWVLENGCHKHTRAKQGKLMRRSPYFILDSGVNSGIVEWYYILLNGRCPDWPKGYSGAGDKALPETGIRLLLYPSPKAIKGTTSYWKNAAIGGKSLNPIGPVVQILQVCYSLRNTFL